MKKPSTIAKDINKLFDTPVAVVSPDRPHLVLISCETKELTGEYYGSFHNPNDPYINPCITKYVEDQGLFLEWENPGCFGVCHPS